MHYIWKERKKTNEELYEGNIRSDFSSTRKYLFAICFDDFSLLVAAK